MRQLPSDKYNVAWFKLAEFVARGEKERALGLYRLLAHSFDDEALAHQLEGDLLLAFNDDGAVKCYVDAAKYYQKAHRFVQAAAVYEHILSLQPRTEMHILTIIDLYKSIGIEDRIAYWYQELVFTVLGHRPLIAPKVTDYLHQTLDVLIALGDQTQLSSFLTQLEAVDKQYHQKAVSYIKHDS